MSLGTVLFLLLFAGQAPAPSPCDSATTAEMHVRCALEDLTKADGEINGVYQGLMKSLAEEDRAALRQEQRAWIKMRDRECAIGSSQGRREDWLAGLATDYVKAVCVIRLTMSRAVELRSYEPKSTRSTGEDNADALEAPGTAESAQFEVYSRTLRSSGKWYFEISYSHDEILKQGGGALFVGVYDQSNLPAAVNVGEFVYVRPGQPAGTDREWLGVALDLEVGKVYIRRNGAWDAQPGTAGGVDLRTGRPYKGGLDSSLAVDRLMKSGALEVNLGSYPFSYSLPDGYRAFDPQ